MLAVVAAVVVLKGTVTIGPVTPVCRAGTPCDKPAARIVLTFAPRTGVPLHVRTAVNGTYLVRLRPGTYAVTASAGMRISPGQVVVHGRTQRRDFAIDTGIR